MSEYWQGKKNTLEAISEEADEADSLSEFLKNAHELTHCPMDKEASDGDKEYWRGAEAAAHGFIHRFSDAMEFEKHASLETPDWRDETNAVVSSMIDEIEEEFDLEKNANLNDEDSIEQALGFLKDANAINDEDLRELQAEGLLDD